MNMKAFIAAGLAVTLGACMSTGSIDADGDTSMCTLKGTDAFIGQKATQDLGAKIQGTTGAEIFNWVAPDMILTADFRPNRVRVSYDDDYLVTRIACG